MFSLARLGWRNLWRHRRRTLITATAMALGLAFCMAMTALIDGTYADLFDQMITRSVGHAQIHHPEYPKRRAMWETIDDVDRLVAEIDAQPAVQHTTMRLFGYALVGVGDEVLGGQLIGVVPEREAALTDVTDQVISGRFLSPTPQAEAVLGSELAKRLTARVGDELVVVTQSADGSMGNELYTVVGVVKSSSMMVDHAGIYLHLPQLQELLVLPDQVHEIAVVGTRDAEIEALIASLTPAATDRGLLLRSWSQIDPQLAQMLEMGDAVSGIFLLVVFGVAALGILNTMLMSVFERTRELGVIRALGLSPWQLVRLIVWETVALVVVSLAIGLPLGLGMDAYLIFHGLDLSAVMQDMSVMGTAYPAVLMGAYDGEKVTTLVVGLFVVSLGAAIWPAVRAARLQPVAAMRTE